MRDMLNMRAQIRSKAAKPGMADARHGMVHLSDEDFAGMLFSGFSGGVPAHVQAHLDACPECALEAERAVASLDSFEHDSRLWAERRAAVMPVVYPARRPIPAWLQAPAAWAVASVALLIATTIGLPGVSGVSGVARQGAGREGAVAEQAAESAAADASVSGTVATRSSRLKDDPKTDLRADVKEDNDLLSAIDGKLRANATPSAEFYGLQVEEQVAKDDSPHEVAD